MTDRILTVVIFLTLGCSSALAQEYCLNNPDPQVRGSVGVGLQIDPESTSQSVQCTQYFKANVGQRLVFVAVSEVYLQDFAPCANTVNPLCDSAYTFNLTNLGTGAVLFSRSRSTNGLDGAPSGSEWTSEQTADGTLWTRKTTKVYDVSSQTGQSAAIFLFSMQTTRSPNFNVIGFELFFDGTFVFDLSQTDFSILPRDSRETAVAKCDEPQNFCTVDYYAGFSGGNGFQAKITFELAKPAGMSTYRPGTSSNFSYRPDPQSPSSPDSSSTDPDFVLEASQVTAFDAATSAGQEIVTQDEVSYGAVTVRSRDYGGSTVLRAKAMIGGEWIYAAPPPAYDTSFNQLPAASCAVGEGDTRPFTQIPIDVDCNGIADSWEYDFAMAKLNDSHLPVDWDDEATPTTASGVKRGDGFSAFDEYRGFHIVDSGSVVHKRTDPTILTVFYSDQSASKTYQPGFKDLHDNKLQGIVELFEVNDSQYSLSAGGRVRFINRYSSAPTDLHNYPALVVEAVSEDPDCGGNTYGITAILGKSDIPIKMCTGNILAAANGDATLETVSLAVLVQHELGHRFSLGHYGLSLPYRSEKLTDAQADQSLLPTEYAESQQSGNDFYIRARYRHALTAGIGYIRFLDNPDYHHLGAVAGLGDGGGIPVNLMYPPSNSPDPGSILFNGVVRFTAISPLSSAPAAAYQSDVRLEKYYASYLMSYLFEFGIAERNLSSYGFCQVASGDPALQDDLSFLKLN